MDRIRKKLKSDREHKSIESEREEEYTLGKDKRDERQKKTKTIRKEIRELKRELQSDKKTQDPQENVEQSNEISHNESTQEYKQDKKKYELMKSQIPLRGSSRQDFTLALLAKFQKKLACAKQKVEENSEAEVSVQESATSTGSDDENWLTHKLHFESNTPVLAKDASTKNDDWFEIYDPRNPINKRRREASKDAMRQKERR